MARCFPPTSDSKLRRGDEMLFLFAFPTCVYKEGMCMTSLWFREVPWAFLKWLTLGRTWSSCLVQHPRWTWISLWLSELSTTEFISNFELLFILKKQNRNNLTALPTNHHWVGVAKTTHAQEALAARDNEGPDQRAHHPEQQPQVSLWTALTS